MELGFNPVPKPLKKEKEPYKGLQTRKPLKKTALKVKPPKKKVPVFGEKQEKKKIKKPEKVPRLGLKLPSRAIRNSFTDKERAKINKAFGGAKCAACGNPYIEHHHAKFRSPKADGSGRGVWRNGVPLCHTHHELCHTSIKYAQKWRDFLKEKYGKYYFMDMYDLWLLGKIDDPNEKAFENFMLSQRKGGNNEASISS